MQRAGQTGTARPASNTAMLVTAHPDDETMFFAPALVALRPEYTWCMLCLSTGVRPLQAFVRVVPSVICHRQRRPLQTGAGNAEGLGHVRAQELERAARYLQVQLITSRACAHCSEMQGVQPLAAAPVSLEEPACDHAQRCSLSVIQNGRLVSTLHCFACTADWHLCAGGPGAHCG